MIVTIWSAESTLSKAMKVALVWKVNAWAESLNCPKLTIVVFCELAMNGIVKQILDNWIEKKSHFKIFAIISPEAVNIQYIG